MDHNLGTKVYSFIEDEGQFEDNPIAKKEVAIFEAFINDLNTAIFNLQENTNSMVAVHAVKALQESALQMREICCPRIED